MKSLSLEVFKQAAGYHDLNMLYPGAEQGIVQAPPFSPF